MGAAAYNRGSKAISNSIPTPPANLHAAIEDENARLRARCAELERDLARARRCLAVCRTQAEERRGEREAERRTEEFRFEAMSKILARTYPAWTAAE